MTIVENDYDHLYKILVMGDSGVGKSSLLMRFVDGIFTENMQTTIGVDFLIKTMKYNDKKIKFQLWDTAGQERFKSLTKAHFRGAHAIIIAFDLTRLDSFINVQKWINEISIYNETGHDKYIIIVGTKCDMISERRISSENLETFKKSSNIKYMETSAKMDIGVCDIFIDLCKSLLANNIPIEHNKKISNSILLNAIRTKSSEKNKIIDSSNVCCY